MNTAKRHSAHRATGLHSSRFVLCVAFAFVVLCSLVSADEMKVLDVIALSAQDQKAVVRTAAGEMKTVAPGDVLPDQLTVEKVMADKLVLKDSSSGDELWISIAAPGKNSEITRLSKRAPNQEMPEPTTITLPLDSKATKRSAHGR